MTAPGGSAGTPADAIGDVLRLLGGGLLVGEPRTSQALTLVPLAGGVPAPSYRTASDAAASGALTIGELEGGRVPQLVVRNAGDLPVLLLDGEHLEGAMQHRVLNASVLAAARHDTVIPVSCVERGRWGYAGRRDVAPGDDLAYSELRALKAAQVAAATRAGRGRRADQGAVWADIERKRAQVGGGRSRTDAMRDAYDDRRGTLERVVGAFPQPEPGQTGVLAFAGDRPLALDAFDRAETLAGMWQRLLRGYAMDTLAVPAVPLEPHAARGFLAAAADPDNDATAHEGVGLGIDVLVTSPTTVASALTWEGAVVHLAVFPRSRPDGPRGGSRPRADRIERPSTRARNRRGSWFR
jgi:hypothetical protein